MVELYLHSAIRLHGTVFNLLSTLATSIARLTHCDIRTRYINTTLLKFVTESDPEPVPIKLHYHNLKTECFALYPAK
jgi:hypothetical protein